MGFFTTLFNLSVNQTVLADTKKMVITDVKTDVECQDGHVQNSLNIDILNSKFKNKIENLDENKTYKIYCRSGKSSGQLEKIMKSFGFKDVENFGSLNQKIKKLCSTCEGKNC